MLVGGVAGLGELPSEIDAVVSLCRVEPPRCRSRCRVPPDRRGGRERELDFTLWDAADAVAQPRAEGRTVYLHCVQAHTRTPVVATLYGRRVWGVTSDQAVADLARVLPASRPNRDFGAALRRPDDHPVEHDR